MSANAGGALSRKVCDLLSQHGHLRHEQYEAVVQHMQRANERAEEAIINIDGNGKDDVSTIPNFIKAIEKGFDLIQGSRFIPGGKAINTPLSRLIAIKLIHAPFISLLAGFHYTDTTNGYRAYSRKLLADRRIAPFRNMFETYELLAYLSVRAPRLGFKVREIPVTRCYPKNTKTPTKISPFKGNLKLLEILFFLACGKYDPK